jgi:hypothetical protein
MLDRFVEVALELFALAQWTLALDFLKQIVNVQWEAGLAVEFYRDE